jgi:hypothetical protein
MFDRIIFPSDPAETTTLAQIPNDRSDQQSGPWMKKVVLLRFIKDANLNA